MLGRLESCGQCGDTGTLRAAEIQGPDCARETQGNRNHSAGLQISGWSCGRGEIDLANLCSIPAPEALPCGLHCHGHDILVPTAIGTPPFREPLQRGCHPRMSRSNDRALQAQPGNVGSPRRNAKCHVRIQSRDTRCLYSSVRCSFEACQAAIEYHLVALPRARAKAPRVPLLKQLEPDRFTRIDRSAEAHEDFHQACWITGTQMLNQAETGDSERAQSVQNRLC